MKLVIDLVKILHLLQFMQLITRRKRQAYSFMTFLVWTIIIILLLHTIVMSWLLCMCFVQILQILITINGQFSVIKQYTWTCVEVQVNLTARFHLAVYVYTMTSEHSYHALSAVCYQRLQALPNRTSFFYSCSFFFFYFLPLITPFGCPYLNHKLKAINM